MGGFMKLFLIRHGESMQNTKENQLIGLPDHKVYLTKKGKEEAFQAGNFLKEYLIIIFYFQYSFYIIKEVIIYLFFFIIF